MVEHNIRSMTGKDLEVFGIKNQRTCRGWVAEREGSPVAICFVENNPDSYVARSLIKENSNLSKIAIWRLSKQFMEKFKSLGYKHIYAIADNNVKGSAQFLERLGWLPLEQVEQGKVMLWVY